MSHLYYFLQALFARNFTVQDAEAVLKSTSTRLQRAGDAHEYLSYTFDEIARYFRGRAADESQKANRKFAASNQIDALVS